MISWKYTPGRGWARLAHFYHVNFKDWYPDPECKGVMRNKGLVLNRYGSSSHSAKHSYSIKTPS